MKSENRPLHSKKQQEHEKGDNKTAKRKEDRRLWEETRATSEIAYKD